MGGGARNPGAPDQPPAPDRSALERELQQSLERERAARVEAQAANEARDQFLAMLAHELRNPVSVIVNALAVLEAGDQHRQERARTVISRQAAHLAQLLGDLLDAARIAGGRIELRRQPVDVTDAIRQALETEGPRLRAKDHRVTLHLSEEPTLVLGDPVRLHQVFANLLHNAAKYTPAGGSIRITSALEAGEVAVRIRDSGSGIPANKLDAIFELFTQADPTLARTEGGLGLGLPVVRKLVELHGGRVQAQSEGRGRGAEFIVRLPLPRTAIDPPSESLQPAGVDVQRVVVVEDNPDGREMLVDLLRLAGHEVYAAGTGAEGIELSQRYDPSVVMLDIGLPDIDGYRVGRVLRQRLGDAVRLVAVTGYSQPQDRERALAAGFDAHVAKPVDPEQLAELLHGF